MNGDGDASIAAVLYASCSTIRRRGSFMSLTAEPPPFSAAAAAAATASPGFFCEEELEIDRHFLDHCFLCDKHLGDGRDIFMYRGNRPFCSEECRQDQIEIDEADDTREKMKHQIPMKKHKDQRRSSPPKVHVRAAAG